MRQFKSESAMWITLACVLVYSAHASGSQATDDDVGTGLMSTMSVARRAPAGLGVFEKSLRTHHSLESARRHVEVTQSTRTAKELDIRVAKALGSKGYHALRISVITDGPEDLEGDITFDYKAPFKYRWQAAFDMGTEKASCGAGVYKSEHATSDGTCVRNCGADEQCKFFSWRARQQVCEYARHCEYLGDPTIEATYEKLQQNYLHSTVVQAKAGINQYNVAGTTFSINLPRENGPTAGIIWSDPCVSGRWIGCQWAEPWNTFNRSYEMMNALAEDDNWHFFQILGDNFYDQDGRISKSIFDKFSLKTKSKILYTVAGNHDLWVCGSPGCGDEFDQFGYGLAQFYGQDTLASQEAQFLSFDHDPDAGGLWSRLNNNHRNLFWYNKLGSIGFIGYAGGATLEESLPDFTEACSFMATANVDHVVLLGHWDASGMGCAPDMTVPEVFRKLQTLPGCNIGDRLKAFDGHTHCNHVQLPDQTWSDNSVFMIGGHGMSGCSQYGFAYIEASGGDLRVYYFEERSASKDNYADILACVRAKGIAGCKEYASTWLEGHVELYA